MDFQQLVIAVVILLSLCAVPPAALALARMRKALEARRLDGLVRRNEALLRSVAASNGAADDELLAQLGGIVGATLGGIADAKIGGIADARLVEQLIDAAAALANRPVSDFHNLYDGARVTERYIAALETSRSWRKRAFAAEKLGLIGSASALPALLAVIRDARDEDEDVRGAALRALARIKDPRAVPTLIEALASPETWLPPRIGEILVSIGEPAIAPLQAELRRSRSEHTRMWAAEILGWLEARSAAPTLIEALSDISPEVRARAAAALGRIKDDRSVHRLLELLVSDPAPFVRVKVSHALGAIGHPAVIDYLIATLKDPEWWVRVRVVEALEKLGKSAVAALLPALEDEDAEVRRCAAMALERIGYVDTLLDEYGTPAFKSDVRRILLLVARAGVIESLSQRLATSEGALRKRIVRLFGEAEVKEAGGPLLDLLAEADDWSLEARIIESLGKVGAVEAVPRLIECLRDDEEWVRRSAVEALGRLDARESAEEVARILDDPSPMARESALAALVRLGVSDRREKIEQLLADPTPQVRRSAIEALRELGIPLAPEAAAALLTDTSEEVKAEAVGYFARMGDAERARDVMRLLPRASPELLEAIVAYFGAAKGIRFAEIRAALPVPGLEPHALAALIEIASLVQGEDARELVEGFTQSADSVLRERAFASLARFGVDGRDRTFARALFDPAARVRIAVLSAIAAHPSRELVRRARILVDDPDESVRTTLALTIGASGLREFAPCAEKLLDDPCPKVRAGALIGLAAFGDPSLIGIIRARWKTSQARAAINDVKHDGAFTPVLELIMAGAARANNVEEEFILAEDERELTRTLIERIGESHDVSVRIAAMEILTMLPAGEFLTPILGIMKSDPLAQLRIQAMEIVSAAARTEESVSAAASMLLDPSPAVRTRAAEILGRHGTPAALEALLHVLDTSDRKFRETVTTALSEMAGKNPERFDELLTSIPESKARKIGMIWLMGKTRKRGSMGFLASMLAERDPDVRAAAVGALAKFKRSRLLGSFERLLYDPSERVRAAAVNAIAALGTEEARALCEKALEDIDEYVRRRAVVALARIDPAAALALLRSRASTAPELASYVSALQCASGVSCSPALRGDPVAKSIVAELCPEEELWTTFRASPDKSRRLHAYRVLSLIGAGDDGELAELAARDPSAEIREEALPARG